MKQQVRFCTSSDGVRIAWCVTGAGAPLVMSASWLTHLEHQ
jgi:flavoprotein